MPSSWVTSCIYCWLPNNTHPSPTRSTYHWLVPILLICWSTFLRKDEFIRPCLSAGPVHLRKDIDNAASNSFIYVHCSVALLTYFLSKIIGTDSHKYLCERIWKKTRFQLLPQFHLPHKKPSGVSIHPSFQRANTKIIHEQRSMVLKFQHGDSGWDYNVGNALPHNAEVCNGW